MSFFSIDSVIKVSDITERIEELREEITTHHETRLSEMSTDDEAMGGEREELQTLQSLMEKLKGNAAGEQWEGNWYPAALISENYIEQYLDGIYTVPEDLESFITITPDYTDLKMDYTAEEYEGNTFYYR